MRISLSGMQEKEFQDQRANSVDSQMVTLNEPFHLDQPYYSVL